MAPLCAEFCPYMCTHGSEHLLSPHGTLTDVALCLSEAFYVVLGNLGGFNSSGGSVLHIKGQLFYSQKIGGTQLLYYSFSYWFVKLAHTHLHTSVSDYCEFHIPEVSMI